MWRRAWCCSYGVLKRSAFRETALVGRRSDLLPSLISSPLYGQNGGENRREGRFLDSLLTNAISHSTKTQLSLSFSTSGDSNNTKDDNEEAASRVDNNGGGGNGGGHEHITCEEAKRLMRLVNVEALKAKLGMDSKECISYNDLLTACQSMGIARSPEEAVTFAHVLDDAGVVLLFRDKVYLHPDKVVELVKSALPLALTADDDPSRDEMKRLQEIKEEVDMLAHGQVRRILWCGLGLTMIHVVLFFRLTFWEFSWDVMEPIAFFVTATSIVVGYGYFLLTSRDPSYEDLMKRLFLSRQKKLFKKLKFDCERYKELQRKCQSRPHANKTIKNRAGWEVELEDAMHKG